jgi:hypothetical protein
MLIRKVGIYTAKEYTRYRSSSLDLKEKLPAQPRVFYKGLWKGWNDFTGIEHKTTSVDISKIQQIALEMGIKSREEWRLAVCTQKIDAPIYVSKVQGFSNWSQFLALNEYWSFEDLLKYTRKLGIKTQTDWRQWCRDNERHQKVPFDLHYHYKNDFNSLNLKNISFWRYIFVGELKA